MREKTIVFHWEKFPITFIALCSISFMKMFAYPPPQFFRNYLEFYSPSKLTIMNSKLIVLRKAKLAEFYLKNVFEIVKEIQLIYICLYCVDQNMSGPGSGPSNPGALRWWPHSLQGRNSPDYQKTSFNFQISTHHVWIIIYLFIEFLESCKYKETSYI